MYTLYCRTFQSVYRLVAKALPWRQPLLLEGENSVLELPALLYCHSVRRVLVVTDSTLPKLGLLDGLLDELQTADIQSVMYDKTVPNPTIDNVEEALALYHSERCDGIIAFGGGSAIDCAKGVAARVARPDRTLPQLKGQLKVRKETPPLAAIPTTAGTGSEATIVSVVSDSRTHEKYAINDPVLTPRFAVLDPLLTVNLPKLITSTTGMDALTHAVEAYIGGSTTPATRAWSLEAARLIFVHLPAAYSDGHDNQARKNMQRAAYLAGRAFTRSYVGYIHAIAHTLGGFYNVPHGFANAVIMPYVLDYYGESVHKPLAELALAAGLGDNRLSDAGNSLAFIRAVRQLNVDMGIPDTISGIREEDIPLMIDRALAEANPLYPVPRILGRTDLRSLYDTIRD
ncbi:iron-containing alcohol dehydrogenase [Sporosarcina trichiuri]|uniref:iron-containing alcohol dehydrogenase n=1 Tax=Sporosarcina trichiuri TaxID=3056445 RepID=UPI0025B539DC|nr:iron-containing alcohol dehydrogenase [Sporosarcina sp. 0.2-SM1T-5]WJY28133.1 iron-containing alcohol dehydrogenase [Sporosarcina sp. 0.2-SM1T-5]